MIFFLLVLVNVFLYGTTVVAFSHLIRRRALQNCRGKISEHDARLNSTPDLRKITIRSPHYHMTLQMLFAEEPTRTINFLNSVLRLKYPITSLELTNPYSAATQYEYVTRGLETIECVTANKRFQYFIALDKTIEGRPGLDDWVRYDFSSLLLAKSFQSKTKYVILTEEEDPAYLKNKDDIFVQWNIAEATSHEKVSDVLSWTFISLPRFVRSLNLTTGAVPDFTGDPASAWLYLLSREEDTEVIVSPELTANDTSIRDAYYRLANLSDEDLEAIEHEIYVTEENEIERGYRIEETKKEIAKSLILLGISNEIICGATKLPITSIEQLRNNPEQ